LPKESSGATHSEFDEPPSGPACHALAGKEVQERMKKSKLLFLLLPFLAAASYAQESRQDVSVSGSALFTPFTFGQGVRYSATNGYGVLASYRYMLTPRSAVEGNYQYLQNVNKYSTNFLPYLGVHTRFQEVSAAYVYNFTYKKFNPFIEAGLGGYILSPIDDEKTTDLTVKKQTNIGFLYGGGISYEISPSFDIRAEYRGIVMKTPNFGKPNEQTGSYYNLSNPTIGVAYHF
jgi:outer membrane immunogenic protein